MGSLAAGGPGLGLTSREWLVQAEVVLRGGSAAGVIRSVGASKQGELGGSGDRNAPLEPLFLVSLQGVWGSRFLHVPQHDLCLPALLLTSPCHFSRALGTLERDDALLAFFPQKRN